MKALWLVVIVLALVAGAVAAGGGPGHALAAVPASLPAAEGDGKDAPTTTDAFLFFQPSTTAGNCPAPANGGTTDVGCRFVLDLMLNTGTNPIPNGATTQQSYLIYTHQLIKSARLDQIATACVITNTATLDGTTFDAVLQNEVCNGGPGGTNDSPCTFRGVSVAAGSFAFASGALPNCPEGCDGTFRVAQVALCAVAPGQARMHWQFTPPAPATRDTQIVRLDGDLIHDPLLFSDYVINIAGATFTPTPTATLGSATSTPTNTPVPPTNTNTAIPTNTLVPTNTNTNTPTNTNTVTFTRTNTNTPTNTNTVTFTRTSTPIPATNTPTNTPTLRPDQNALLFFQPGTAGNCPAPASGGTTDLGCRFVLDLMLDAGSNPIPNGATAQQSYLTFTHQLIKSARLDQIATTCVITNTATLDGTTFDAVLQNEVCNGGPGGTTDGPCTFRGVPVAAGSYAFASGALSNCPAGCDGTFRVAQVGICAVALGQARMHWQFTPPAPAIRDTQIVRLDGEMIQNPALFTDYVINIIGPTNTTELVGHVTWQGRPAQPNALQQLPISLTLKMGSNEVNYPSRNTDASGYFTQTVVLPNGVYNWRAKGPKYLANSGTVTLAGAPATNVEMRLMRAGDCNNDNRVNTIDFLIIRYSFGKVVGEPGYDDRADLSGDNRVTVSDLNQLLITIGIVGAPPINPGSP